MYIRFIDVVLLLTSAFFLGAQSASFTVNVKDFSVVKEILAFDNEPQLHFSCFDGMMLQFVSGHYGRYDIAEQEIFRSRGIDIFEYNVDAVGILNDQCEYLQQCFIPTSSSINPYFFGATSECPMGARYLKTFFQCVPRHLAVCESNDVTITCPAGTKIKVNNSFYGRNGDDSICFNPASPPNMNCFIPNPPSVMNCVGKTTCTIFSTNAQAGGDPCFGALKFTYIDYTCGL